MRYFKNFKTIIFCTTILVTSTTTAFAQDFGVGFSLGTDGVGIEAKTSINPYISLTGGAKYLNFDHDETLDDIDFSGKLKFSTLHAIVNIHPFRNSFLIAGGGYLGDKNFEILADTTSSIMIGDIVYTPAEVGVFTGEIKLKTLTPYAGIGFDNFATTKGNWSFNAQLGVMFTSSPEISLQSSAGLLSGTPALESEIEREISLLEDKIDRYKYYPVVSLGITRKF